MSVVAVVKVDKKRYEKERGGGVKKRPKNKKLLRKCTNKICMEHCGSEFGDK